MRLLLATVAALGAASAVPHLERARAPTPWVGGVGERFNPQPDTPGVAHAHTPGRGAPAPFNPQPEPPGDRYRLSPAIGRLAPVALNPQPELPGK
ncbi:hypothetical protein Q8F55_001699 [Vanrija albida]|uniref:Uncharacterized protein n=1 Tax=Vanrija albida TaxID=181172 RepID=A0ABR3Q7X5_9TREE